MTTPPQVPGEDLFQAEAEAKMERSHNAGEKPVWISRKNVVVLLAALQRAKEELAEMKGPCGPCRKAESRASRLAIIVDDLTKMGPYFDEEGECAFCSVNCYTEEGDEKPPTAHDEKCAWRRAITELDGRGGAK